MARIRIRIHTKQSDPYQIEKQDPDPYQNDKQGPEPDPYQKGPDPQDWYNVYLPSIELSDISFNFRHRKAGKKHITVTSMEL